MSAITKEFHEITGGGDAASSIAAAVENADDVRHQVPYDKSHVHVWMVEAAIIYQHHEGEGSHHHVLTQDGITQIAFHKYHAGQNTILDGILNPIWAYLTECLPMSMAPNLVTLLGGAHCLAAYLITWYFTTDFNAASLSSLLSSTSSGSSSSSSSNMLFVVVPCWVLFANAYGQMAYYTLDCMDGKQARRTKSSSPVGQLFDHGIDCLCLLAHLSSVHAYLGCGSGNDSGDSSTNDDGDTNLSFWFFATQASLQVSFFLAQWEEYYTGVLPHCCGQVGVTETNYGLAVASLVNGLLLWLHPQRFATFYSKPLLPIIFSSNNNNSIIRAILVRFCNVVLDISTESLLELQVKQGVVIVWVALMGGLILLCLRRVYMDCCYNKRHHHDAAGLKLYLSALSKLWTPIIVSACPFFIPLTMYQQRPGTLRFVHLAVGLCMALLTIKLIVFAMSRQAYAAVQGDGIPIVLAILWIRNDHRLTLNGVHLLFVLLTVWYLYRIASWTNAALTQLCQRLQIHVFSITPPPPPPPTEKSSLKASTKNVVVKHSGGKKKHDKKTNEREHNDAKQQHLEEKEASF